MPDKTNLLRCLLARGRCHIDSDQQITAAAELRYFYLLYPVATQADRLTPITSFGELAAQIDGDPIFGRVDLLTNIIAIENEETQQKNRSATLVDECPDLLGPVQEIYDQLILVYGDPFVRKMLLKFLNGTVQLSLNTTATTPRNERDHRAAVLDNIQDRTSYREIFYHLMKSEVPSGQVERLLKNLLDASLDHALSPMRTFVVDLPEEPES